VYYRLLVTFEFEGQIKVQPAVYVTVSVVGFSLMPITVWPDELLVCDSH
jgi:hypothetical protein